MAAQNNRPITTIDGAPTESRADLVDLQDFLGAWGRRPPEDVLNKYRRLSPAHAKTKQALATRMRAARHVSASEYDRAVGDFRAAFPDDATVYLISADPDTLRGRHDQAIACIDRFESMIGGDPYLDTIRSKIYLLKDDYPAAKQAALSAIAKGDKRPEPLHSLLKVSLRERTHGETLRLLKKFVYEHKLVFDEIDTNPDYAEFLGTPEFAEWQKFAGVQTVPNDEEALAFGHGFEQAVSRGDHAGVNALFDWEEVIHRAEVKVGFTADERNRYHPSALRDWTGPKGLFFGVCTAVADGGSYRLLHILEREGRKVATFRLLTSTGDENYHEVSLARRGDGRVVATDVLIYLTGDRVSEIVRRGAVLFLARAELAAADRFAGADNDLFRSFETFVRLDRAINENRHAEILTILDELPESLRNERSAVAWRLISGLNVNLEAAAAAARVAEEKFAGEAWLEFNMRDVHFARKDYRRSLAAAERLNRLVGGDPYLDTYCAWVHEKLGDTRAARAAAQKAIENGDERPEPYLCILAASLREKKHEETLSLLQAVAERFGVVIENLESNEKYAEFVKSPQFAQWQKLATEYSSRRP